MVSGFRPVSVPRGGHGRLRTSKELRIVAVFRHRVYHGAALEGEEGFGMLTSDEQAMWIPVGNRGDAAMVR
jgi:hypothetical protein